MILLLKINNFLNFIENVLSIKEYYPYGIFNASRGKLNKMNNINLNDFDNIKIIYNRIPKDNSNIKATILWKQDSDLVYSDDTSVYAGIGDRNKDKVRLTRISNTNVWVGELKIRNVFSKILTFEKHLYVKLIEYKVMPCNGNLSYVI